MDHRWLGVDHDGRPSQRARAVRGLPHRRRHWRTGIIYKSIQTGGRRIRTTCGMPMCSRIHHVAPETVIHAISVESRSASFEVYFTDSSKSTTRGKGIYVL